MRLQWTWLSQLAVRGPSPPAGSKTEVLRSGIRQMNGEQHVGDRRNRLLSVPHMNEDFEYGQRPGSGGVDDGAAHQVLIVLG